MLIMAAHETLRGTVTGTVDDTYDENDLCDGDTSTPVRVESGSLSLAIAGASQSVNGLAIVNHNLDAGVSAVFSGLGTVVAPTVPPGDIRQNGVTVLDTPVTVSGTTLSIETGSPGTAIILGEAFVGLFREVWTLPPGSDHPHTAFGILPGGEYGGLSYSKGAQARRFGGQVYLSDADYAVMLNAYLASKENSLPTLIVPFPEEAVLDVWAVTWETFNPHPLHVDIWEVDVVWQELPRYRW